MPRRQPSRRALKGLRVIDPRVIAAFQHDHATHRRAIHVEAPAAGGDATLVCATQQCAVQFSHWCWRWGIGTPDEQAQCRELVMAAIRPS